MISAAVTGFFTGFSLILAIGAQNAFVLRQGLLREHVFAICLLCALSDSLLIAFGVAGIGRLVDLNPEFPRIMAFGGAIFLLFYALSRFWAVLKSEYVLDDGNAVRSGIWPVLLTGLALTWLNPHVYLDTLGLIGAVSTQFVEPTEKLLFGLSAAIASFVFFFSLGFGARYLEPVMRTKQAWQVFDVIVGGVMLMIAFGLVVSAI